MPIIWKPYLNPYSHQEGLIGQSSKLDFKILPTSKFTDLILFDGYTGIFLKRFRVSEFRMAQDLAVKIDRDVTIGYDINTILEKLAEPPSAV